MMYNFFILLIKNIFNRLSAPEKSPLTLIRPCKFWWMTIGHFFFAKVSWQMVWRLHWVLLCVFCYRFAQIMVITQRCTPKNININEFQKTKQNTKKKNKIKKNHSITNFSNKIVYQMGSNSFEGEVRCIYGMHMSCFRAHSFGQNMGQRLMGK